MRSDSELLQFRRIATTSAIPCVKLSDANARPVHAVRFKRRVRSTKCLAASCVHAWRDQYQDVEFDHVSMFLGSVLQGATAAQALHCNQVRRKWGSTCASSWMKTNAPGIALRLRVGPVRVRPLLGRSYRRRACTKLL